MSALDASDHHQNGLLSDATLAALQLRHQPFGSDLHDASASVSVSMSDPADENSTDPAFIDTITEEQLADIKQTLITGDDLLLILGEQGAGKTTLLRQLDTHSGLRIQCFAVTGSERFSTVNLFSGMLEAFKVKPPEKLKNILDQLIPCLQSMVARNTLSAIVLDDADKVNESELTQLLSGMLYMNSQDDTLVRIALAAPAEFEELIPDLLPEGADLPYSSLTIEGLSPGRAAAYLDHRLALAGFDQEFPFTERDMASLVDHSGGRPAELHTLTADVLNEKYGRLEHSMPGELRKERAPGFAQSRTGKLALGALATVLIVGGLLMFMPSGDAPERQPTPESADIADTQPPIIPEVAERQPVELNDTQTPENQLSQGVALPDSENTNASEPSTASDVAANDTSPESLLTEPDAAGQTGTTAADTARTTDEDVQSSDASDSQTDNLTGGAASAGDSASNDDSATSAVEPGPSVEDVSAPEMPETSVEADAPEQLAELPVQPSAEPAGTAESTDPSTETVSVDDSVDAELQVLLESPTWILVQDESLFTIQLSASRDLPSVENFLRQNPLPGPNSIFSFERENEVWYALVHGSFPTLVDAQQYVELMPAGARRDQPWIRSIARLKQILREP